MPSNARGTRSKLFVPVMGAVLMAALPAPADQLVTVQRSPVTIVAQATIDARQTLAQAGVGWIASKTGWKTASVPRIEIRSSADLSTMFFGNAEGFEGVRPLALYSRDQHILFLSAQLALGNLLDQSILLHELVHHMQVINDAAFDCREETERQAYRLQAQWLSEHGIVHPYAFLGIPESQIEGLICP